MTEETVSASQASGGARQPLRSTSNIRPCLQAGILISANLLAILAGSVYAQDTSRYSDDPDAETVVVLRALAARPEKAPTDPAIDDSLLKQYRMEEARARWVESRPSFDPEAVADPLALVQELAVDAYLSSLFEDSENDPGGMADAEAREFYDEHPESYRRSGTTSYVQVQLLDTTPESVELAREHLRQWIETASTGVQPRKSETPGFTINLESNQEVGPTHPYFEALREAAPWSIYGPFSPSGGTGSVMILVTEFRPSEVLPFESVRSDVFRDVADQRSKEARNRRLRAAERSYPIRFSGDYRDYKQFEGVVPDGIRWGAVGSVRIDDAFLGGVQLIHPEFYFSPDPKTFTENLNRFYAFPKLEAEWCREREREAADRQSVALPRVRSIARVRYLASLWSRFADAETSVSDEEARHYYESHRGEFLSEGTFSVLLALLDHHGRQTQRLAKAALKDAVRSSGDYEELKLRERDFTIVHVDGLRRVQDPELFDFLAQAEGREPHGPVTVPSYTMPLMILITESASATPREFEAVRDTCIDRVRQTKLQAIERRLLQTSNAASD